MSFDPNFEEKSQPLDEKGNPNAKIPKFISDAPWYGKEPTRELLPESHGIEDQFVTVSERPKKKSLFKQRKNVCANCGMAGHQKPDCLERPRKGKGNVVVKSGPIQVKNLTDWDSKRDRWHGYDAAAEVDNQILSWAEKERKRKGDESMMLKIQEELEEQMDEEMLEMIDLGLIEGPENRKIHIDIYTEKAEKLPVRSMEDKPAYLLSLSGKPEERKEAQKKYLNDPGMFSKGKSEYAKMSAFAKKNDNEGDLSINPEASPTAAALAMKKFTEKGEKERAEKRRKILEKYGG